MIQKELDWVCQNAEICILKGILKQYYFSYCTVYGVICFNVDFLCPEI